MKRLLFGVAVVTCLAAATDQRWMRGASLVVRAADLQGFARDVADRHSDRIVERALVVPAAPESMRARLYAPVGASHLTVLLVTGLHPGGIGERRLVRFSRELARSGVTVVTPDIPELRQFEISPIVTDRIERAAVWLATQSGLAPARRIGLMGVSFSGGLSIVAAGRPALRNHLLFVLSFGGHDDLGRVLEYFCAGDAAGPAHDYGLAVGLLNVAGQVVPPDQVEPLRAGVRLFLHGSYIDRFDTAAAEKEFVAGRELARALPEPSKTLLEYVNNRDVRRLGPLLRLHIASYVNQPALSPSRSSIPAVPVFLLHGRDDRVIPSAESRYLAGRLRAHVPVRLLITNLISHAEADQPAHPLDVLRLAVFWGDLLHQ